VRSPTRCRDRREDVAAKLEAARAVIHVGSD
jgi:hypothetical protein